MIKANKCTLSHHSDKSCEFARLINDETHCMLVLEWWPEDTRVENLKRCMVKLRSRERLAFRNSMIKKKKKIVAE